jgi:sigma-B regulation protein RsbU (phosphoserine phosphatase)
VNRFFQFQSIRSKILFAFSIVTLASTIAFTTYAYVLQRRTIIDGIDQKLKVAALSVQEILSDGFHDRVIDSNSISADEHFANIKRLTAFANRAGVSFVYSFVKRGDNIYFASTSGTEEQFKNGTTVPFFERYGDPTPGVVNMFETGETLTESAKDEFGNFRSVLIPLNDGQGRTYVVGADIYIDEVRQRLNRTLLLCISIGAVSFVAVFLIGALLSNRIAHPLTMLAEQSNKLAANNFAPDSQTESQLAGMAKRSNDEVTLLARAFEQMLKKLAEYIEDLKVTTAAKERIESELKIAHDIQMSFLPKIYPKKAQFDLYATLEPAKEVGGDLYDFCLLDEDRLFFYVGDVSDKGVPAALFMAVTMSLMKRTAQQPGINPADLLMLVNRDLASENENLLFVTLFCAILNFKTGEMNYSNAGHNPPVIIRANGKSEWLKLPDGLVLAVMPETPYQTKSTVINKGDTVLLYTDGVTEAMNPAHQLYSDDRLLKTAATLADRTAVDVVKQVVTSVKEHAAGAPQSDDITVMALKFQGA